MKCEKCGSEEFLRNSNLDMFCKKCFDDAVKDYFNKIDTNIENIYKDCIVDKKYLNGEYSMSSRVKK